MALPWPPTPESHSNTHHRKEKMYALQTLTLLGLFIIGALGESLNRDLRNPPRPRKPRKDHP